LETLQEAIEDKLKRRYRVFEDPESLLTENWPTPLLKLSKVSDETHEVWAKLEFYNPFSHSIKDRAIWNMFRKALEKGLHFDKLYEATSGNVGIALVALSNIYGKKFRAFIPKGTPETTEILLKVLGAEVVRTEFEVIDRTFIEYVKKKAAEDKALNLNQFENDANFEVHYNYTSLELLKQLEVLGKKPKCIIAGVGTSGHIAALAARFKETFYDVKVVGVEPSPGNKIPGIKRIETRPKWIAHVKIDEVVDVRSREAIEGAIEIARLEGILIGLSSGAVYQAFKKIRNKYGPGTYILIFPDDAFKYIEEFREYLKPRTTFNY